MATTYSQVNFNDTFSTILKPKIQKSLDAVVDPETGEIVCQSALDGNDPACVPYNIFGTGPVTQESLDSISSCPCLRG